MNTTYPPTAKQVAFATRLLNEKAHGYDTAKMIDTLPDMGKKGVSALIDLLLTKPSVNQPKHAGPGYYIASDDEVYVVVENRAKTNTYAKRLVASETIDGKTKVRWDYAPGAAARLAASQPLTVEDAARLGHLHGACIICCRPLTDPDSVKRGIGPVCATRI